MRSLGSLRPSAVASFSDIPLDWSAFQDETLIQNQGSFFQGSDVCCSLESPDCQIQVQNQAGQFYFGYSANATAQVFGDGSSIVSLYNTIGGWEFGVEMEVAPSQCCASALSSLAGSLMASPPRSLACRHDVPRVLPERVPAAALQRRQLHGPRPGGRRRGACRGPSWVGPRPPESTRLAPPNPPPPVRSMQTEHWQQIQCLTEHC